MRQHGRRSRVCAGQGGADTSSFRHIPPSHSMSALTKTRPERPRPAVDVLAPLGSVLKEQDTRRLDLAQRLHRDVAGGLVACATMSEMIRHELAHSGGNDAMAGMLTNLEAALRQTIQVVRDLTGEQLPAVLKTFGLGCALEQLAQEAGDGGCRVEVAISGQEPVMPITHRLSLHQILQSLVRRILKHGTAWKVDVICVFDPARVEVLIEHNGADVMNKASQDQPALAAIKGRIKLIGARLLVSRSTEQGLCRLRLVIPLPLKGDHLSDSQPPSSPTPANP